MTRDELKKLLLGPASAMPTPFNARGQVDLGVMHDMVQYWLSQGIVAGKAMIKVTSGADAPDLSERQWLSIVKAATRAAGGQAAIACGLKCKSVRHTIEDIKKATDAGVIGVQVDLPYLKFPTQDDIVRFYTQISDAVEIGIIVNNTFWFGAPGISTDSIRRLADAEHVVAFKWAVPDDKQYDDMAQFAGVFNFIDNSNQPVRCHKNGGRGYVEGTFAAYPAHGFKVWALLEQRRYNEAQALFDSVSKPLSKVFGAFDGRYGGDRAGKAMMTLMGFPCGDPQSPTMPLSRAELDALRAVLRSFGWPVKG
jgi:4-hydroxy-tetrahydrodipicolinate synthase